MNAFRQNLEPGAMASATSAFLDVLRISSALIVFVHHCAQYWYPPVYLWTDHIAHCAVVVFFVLSGYVISYSTLTKERDVVLFAAARMARLYSVVAPALFLTGLLYVVGKNLNPHFYDEHSRGAEGIRYLLTACFAQNVWHFAASPPTNAPFWSLCYEFWYYVFFGVAVFAQPGGIKSCTLVVLTLVVGPNILLLFPCWLVGVGLFVHRGRLAAFLVKPQLIFFASIAAVICIVVFLRPLPFDLSNRKLLFSGSFLSDWVVALGVGATILSFDAMEAPRFLNVAAPGIRRIADHTFSLYLYHYPLIAFATAVIPFHKSSAWEVATVAGTILLVIYLLSAVTEARRGAWRKIFEKMLRMAPRRAVMAAY